MLLIVGAKLVYSKLTAYYGRRLLGKKTTETLDSCVKTKGHNGSFNQPNKNIDDDAPKETTQTAAGVEYVNVNCTETNPEQEMYCNVDFHTMQASDIAGQNPVDEHVVTPAYEALTSSDRQRASQAAESEYSALEMT